MSYSIAVYSRATRAAYKQGVTVEDVYEFLEK